MQLIHGITIDEEGFYQAMSQALQHGTATLCF